MRRVSGDEYWLRTVVGQVRIWVMSEPTFVLDTLFMFTAYVIAHDFGGVIRRTRTTAARCIPQVVLAMALQLIQHIWYSFKYNHSHVISSVLYMRLQRTCIAHVLRCCAYKDS